MVWYVKELESVLLFLLLFESCSRDEGVIRILAYDGRRNSGGICGNDDLI